MVSVQRPSDDELETYVVYNTPNGSIYPQTHDGHRHKDLDAISMAQRRRGHVHTTKMLSINSIRVLHPREKPVPPYTVLFGPRAPWSYSHNTPESPYVNHTDITDEIMDKSSLKNWRWGE